MTNDFWSEVKTKDNCSDLVNEKISSLAKRSKGTGILKYLSLSRNIPVARTESKPSEAVVESPNVVESLPADATSDPVTVFNRAPQQENIKDMIAHHSANGAFVSRFGWPNFATRSLWIPSGRQIEVHRQFFGAQELCKGRLCSGRSVVGYSH